MVASVIEELSPRDERSNLLREKLAIIQEAQVSAVSAGFAAASNLQLLRRDALLKNFKFQPQVLSSVTLCGRHRLKAAMWSVPIQRSFRIVSVPSGKLTGWLACLWLSTRRIENPPAPFRAGAKRARPRPFQGSKKSSKASSSTSTRQRWQVPGGGSPGRLCPALAESAGQLPGHRHRRGRGGHCFPATTSAHPSKHQFPDQEQPSGPSASSRWLADEGSHRAGLQRDETFVMPTFMFRCIRLSASICVSWSIRRCTSSLVFRVDWLPIHESSPSCCEPPSRCLGSKVWSYTST